MKKYIITIAFSILSAVLVAAFAQETDKKTLVQGLIEEGIELYDAQEYEQAVKKYEEALEVDSNSTIINYELALTYLAMKDYEKASEYSQKVIDSGEQSLLKGAYGIKSEALAGIGQVDKAIDILKIALRNVGSDYYLHFNLALNYFNDNNLDETIYHAQEALELDKFQSSPFLLSAYAFNDKEMWVKSIIAFQFFLIQEPCTMRSKVAFEEMLQTMHVKKDSTEPIERSFIQKQLQRHSDKQEDTKAVKKTPPLDVLHGIDREQIYNAIENTLDSLNTSVDIESIEADSTNSVLYQSFKEVTKTIFTNLSEQNDGTKQGLFWTYQVPVITRILNSPYFEIYCRYISISYFPESLKWWEENSKSVEMFSDWLEKGDKEQ